MTLYDTTKGNILRTELQLVEAGQHYKVYSAKVNYLPENIEKPDFFKLCYGTLSKCDEINIYTHKTGSHEVLYKFIVIEVNIEEKYVITKLITKIDFLNKTNAIEIIEDATHIQQAPNQVVISLEDIEKLIVTHTTSLKTNLEALAASTVKYQNDTDDQLEEIESNIKELSTQNTSTTKKKTTT